MANSSIDSSDIPYEVTAETGEQLFVIARFVMAGISFPVNLSVIVVVSCSRQLHVPRHIFWAGISIIIQFITLVLVAESFVSYPIVCVFYQLSMGLWYPCLLLFLSLAGLDRYLAIRHYEWYKSRMSNTRAVCSMIATWMVNAFITESPYWTGYKSVFDCSANVTHVYYMFMWNLLLAIVNVTLQVKIFLVSRRVIREYPERARPIRFTSRTMSSPLSNDQRASDFRASNHRSELGKSQTSCSMRHNSPPFAIHHRRLLRRNQLDFRAALAMSLNILPFWLFNIPIALNVAAFYWCLRLELGCPTQQMIHLHTYFKLLFFLPCICMPVLYMANGSEFRRASLRLMKRKARRSTTAATMRYTPGNVDLHHQRCVT